MISRKHYTPRPKMGEEIPISVLRIERRDVVLWTARRPICKDRFPPCIRNMISRDAVEEGKHRAAAILASFLGQAGWSEEDARILWNRQAERNGVPENIFDEWFCKMHCPRCSTIQTKSKGYPKLGMADLDCCRPDERCSEFGGPVAYAADIAAEEDMNPGNLKLIRTMNVAKVLDWAAGREGEIELSDGERNELEALLKTLETQENGMLVYTRARISGRLRPMFFLKECEGLRRRMLSELL
jgi:hypothetical protein